MRTLKAVNGSPSQLAVDENWLHIRRSNLLRNSKRHSSASERQYRQNLCDSDTMLYQVMYMSCQPLYLRLLPCIFLINQNLLRNILRHWLVKSHTLSTFDSTHFFRLWRLLPGIVFRYAQCGLSRATGCLYYSCIDIRFDVRVIEYLNREVLYKDLTCCPRKLMNTSSFHIHGDSWLLDIRMAGHVSVRQSHGKQQHKSTSVDFI